MKITLVAVTSLNGKLTNGADPDIYKWTSREDQKFFFDLIEGTKLIVMGSGTYEAVRGRLKTNTSKLRIVLTKNPDKYKAERVPGNLEFSSESPKEVYKRCMIDHTDMLLVGGSKIYSSFIKENLVDEIYLTVEPLVFGEGKNLFAGETKAMLHLESMERLNEKGTVLLKYRILK